MIPTCFTLFLNVIIILVVSIQIGLLVSGFKTEDAVAIAWFFNSIIAGIAITALLVKSGYLQW